VIKSIDDSVTIVVTQNLQEGVSIMKSDQVLEPIDRRMILVATDETYEKLISRIDWKKLSLAAMPVLVGIFPLDAPVMLSFIFGPSLLSSTYLMGQFLHHATQTNKIDKQKNWLENISKWFQVGEIPIPHYCPKEALSLFTFDVDHQPQDGTMYVLNPASNLHYLLPSIANTRLADEKMEAFLRICGDLGAKDATLITVEAKDQEANGSVSAKNSGLEGSASGGLAMKNAADRYKKREYGPSPIPPHLADEMKVWVQSDTVLAGIVYARLNNNVMKDSGIMKLSDQIDINASICADLVKFGFKVGGEYKKVQETTRAYEVEFWPIVQESAPTPITDPDVPHEAHPSLWKRFFALFKL